MVINSRRMRYPNHPRHGSCYKPSAMNAICMYWFKRIGIPECLVRKCKKDQLRELLNPHQDLFRFFNDQRHCNCLLVLTCGTNTVDGSYGLHEHHRKPKIPKKECKNTTVLKLSCCHGNSKNVRNLLVFEISSPGNILWPSFIFIRSTKKEIIE